MNIEREDKIEITIGPRELRDAVLRTFPEEFLLHQLPADMVGVTTSVVGSAGVKWTFVRRVPNAVLQERRRLEMERAI